MTTLSTAHSDVLEIECDVLILKYAQKFFGTALAVAKALGLSERDDIQIPIGEYLHVPSNGRLPCKTVVFAGVPPLGSFQYAEIRKFPRDALSMLASSGCEKNTIALTMHGVGYGLDERESFTALAAGILEYLQAPETHWRPQSITIVDHSANRTARMARFLESIQATSGLAAGSDDYQATPRDLPDAGVASDTKKHIFVAMPFEEEMQDVYEFGICEPVNASGCLCERCDESAFTGEVLEYIRGRIATAKVVVAEMTGSNPNVYLEVGYAWGKGVPTLLIAKKGQELPFDVRTHKCVYYKTISDLRKQLSELIPKLI